MSGSLDFLFGDTPPPSVTGSAASVQGVPDWYQEYLRGIAGQATSLAGMQANQAVPAQSVAGFTPDQIQAFQQARSNVGSWQPALANESSALAGVQPQVNSAVNSANQAVAGPAQSWTSNYQQYMSPYTQSVIDNIATLGNRNWEENIMPGVNNAFVSSGQFGSTRNAQALANAGRDVQQNISAQQAQALEQGYGTASNIFANDAARQQQQQQMQANTAMTGGQLASSTGLNTAQQYGALGAATSGLGLNDASALAASGAQQQQLDQQGLNTAYGNAQNLNNYDWNILNNLGSVVRGMQLPTSTTQTYNVPTTTNYGASPLAQVAGSIATLAGAK
jgi:hypothetical protein